MRTFNSGKITFEYPDEWEVEKADILSNPDCIATLSYEDGSLLNVIIRYLWKMQYLMTVE